MPNIKPFVIAIWSGTSKPNNLDEFLRPLVNELNAQYHTGIMINSFRIDVKCKSFICDSPARAFIKGFNRFFSNFFE